MKAYCRDLGLMDYKACWDLQQTLFDTLVAGKTNRDTGLHPGAMAEYRTGSEQERKSPVAGPGAGVEPAAGTTQDRGNTPEMLCKAAAGAVGESATGTAKGSAPDPNDTASEDAGTILLVEHPPVYTLGKSGHAENLLIGREALEAMGAQFFHIDRGGDITFHGPGQLVCYPILDLERLGIGLRAYIDALEEAVIRTVAEYGIRAGRIAGASGVWVRPGNTGEESPSDNGCTKGGNDSESRPNAGKIPAPADIPRKICAIGVRSSRYITMHGFALNVSTDLEWFSRINPCGFTDRGVTSIERQTGRKIAMGEVKSLVVKFLSEILNVRIYK